VWRRCTPVSFDSLAYANLTLQRRSVTLCPPRGQAILTANARGTTFAAGVSRLDLAGRLGSTPIRLSGGPLGFAWPGSLNARAIEVALGPGANPSHFRISSLAAKIGKEVAGRFSGTEVRLAAVPLDIVAADGAWRYAGGKLSIADAAFRLEDRETDDRFQPLTSKDGALQLANNVITATASLAEPASSRTVATTSIRHDLASGRGDADLAVDDLQFDKALQPDMITRLALGVVANVSGKLRGTGRIDWNEQTVTSTGRFTTDAMDFAAAFGPVKGMSGTVEFTDLLGMVTAPDQRLKLASINPGIEAMGGEVVFELHPDSVLLIKGANWPFLGGTLTLDPSRMQFGASEVRRYTLRIEGLDAAKFVAQMDLGNISASGIFDGAMPLVFDENGGRIDAGKLVSRPPGGNLSYVGALTYKDLSAMANFAFDALKSLNYKLMQVEMDGALEGEIITRLTFDGVSQGAGAKRNFLTKRIAKLPIRFNINVRAQFFQLVRSFRSLYDPAYVTDPRELGLVGADGKPLPGGSAPISQSGAVQPPVSEKKP
jgi:Dicarboxylate transport